MEPIMPPNHLILCHPFLLLPSIFPSISILGGQSIGAPASASVLPMNIHSWFPLRLTGLISLLSKRLSRVFSSTTIWKHQFFGTQPSLWSKSHICTWLLQKPWLWLYESWGFPGGSGSKESACNAGDPDLIPGSGRSPGEEKGYTLQYSGLENSMDRGAWLTAV